MNRKEFQQTFKALVDELPIPGRLTRLAERFARTPETLQKWYDGVSVPANASREMVIKHLYAEQKKREFAAAVRQVIRDELKIEVVSDPYTPVYEGDYRSVEIRLKLGDEVIHTDWITLGY